MGALGNVRGLLFVAATACSCVAGAPPATAPTGQILSTPHGNPKYRSDIHGSAYEWLEDKQRAAYGPAAKPPTLEELKRVIASLPQREGWEPAETILEAVKIAEITLPTRYEDIGPYFLVDSRAQVVRHALGRIRQGGDVPEIEWGTLPTGEVNAAAQLVGKENLVILNRGLFAFLYGSFLTVDRTVAVTREKGAVGLDFSESAYDRAVATNSPLSADYSNLVVAFAANLQPPDIVFADDLEAPIVSLQLNSAERFIVAHEFGHILANDTGAGVRILHLLQAEGGWRNVATNARDWIQELRADTRGLELWAAARTDEPGISASPSPLFEALDAYAPVLFLTIADALEDARFCGGSGQGSRRRLPPAVLQRLTKKASAARESGVAIPSDDPDVKSLGCRLQSHPPAWLRQELLMPLINSNIRDTQEADLARTLVANASKLAVLNAETIRGKLAAAALPD